MPNRGSKQIQDIHLRKHWQTRVKTWFDQPGRKLRRRQARVAKAAAVFPRPTQKLRPAVHAPSARYNTRVRLGRGFSLDELKEAGITPHFAQTIGIGVDYRRRNKSDRSLRVNVQRLKQYKSKLVLFPRDPKKVKKGEAQPGEKVEQQTGVIQPIHSVTSQQTVKLASIDKNASSFR